MPYPENGLTDVMKRGGLEPRVFIGVPRPARKVIAHAIQTWSCKMVCTSDAAF
ncbi:MULTISPECIES: hypothetical protein [unclassified Acinetobacter]|uniref:hypothetical protein n=1 Tax=unclassified Acinetobacter TaxID=196816 RepID=UPI0013F15ABD|nr:hypothetical protein [Acinetobacter sp. ANC 4216]